MFSVEFHPSALKAIRKADAKMRQRVHELAGILTFEPVPAKRYDVRNLDEGFYRVRLSSFRIQYFVDWAAKKIQILDFQRRDEHTYD